MVGELWSFVQANASGIQAVIAILGFVVLCKYGWDTRVIARATMQQSRAVLLPFLAITIERKNGPQEWHIKNLGSGPALNIRYTAVDPKEIVGQKAPIMPGETRRLCSAEDPDRARLGECLRKAEGFEIQYESLSEERLMSRIKQAAETGAIEVKFVRDRAENN